jgi:hypothetical protein
MSSNGIKLIQCFVKISRLVQKLKAVTDIRNTKIS